MKFKLPKTVVVLGKRIRVILKEELAAQGYAGLYDPNEGKIYINPNVPDIEETFFHEYNHAIIHRSGLNQVISRDAEEMICENFATAYAEAFFKAKK
jgi:Zn-dependent peptidase ImmA (M78 family)